MTNISNEKRLNNLIKPIRKWLAGDQHRNALVILSEPRAKSHLVLATNTTGEDMIPDIGMIVGMEPQLCDTLSLILDEAMFIEPIKTNEPDWEDTIDFTASTSGRPDPEDDAPADAESKSNHCRTIVEPFPNHSREIIEIINNRKHRNLCCNSQLTL